MSTDVPLEYALKEPKWCVIHNGWFYRCFEASKNVDEWYLCLESHDKKLLNGGLQEEGTKIDCQCKNLHGNLFIYLCDFHRKMDDLTRRRTAQQIAEKIEEEHFYDHGWTQDTERRKIQKRCAEIARSIK